MNRREFSRIMWGGVKYAAGVAATGGFIYVNWLRTTDQTVNLPKIPVSASGYGPVVDNLHMSKDDLRKFLNIQERGSLGLMFEDKQGWMGPARYQFMDIAFGTPFDTKFVTPYLDTKQQLNNWYYVLYGRQRVDPRSFEVCPADPEIMERVDKRRGGHNPVQFLRR